MKSPLLPALMSVAISLVGLVVARGDDQPSPIPENLTRLASKIGHPWQTYLTRRTALPLKVANWPDVAEDVGNWLGCLAPEYQPKKEEMATHLVLVRADKEVNADIALFSYVANDKPLVMFQTGMQLGLVIPVNKNSTISKEADASAMAVEWISRTFAPSLPKKPQWDTKVRAFEDAYVVDATVRGDAVNGGEIYKMARNISVLWHKDQAVLVYEKHYGSLWFADSDWFGLVTARGEYARALRKYKVQFSATRLVFDQGQENPWREVVVRAGTCPIESVKLFKTDPLFDVEIVEREKGQQFVIRVHAKEPARRTQRAMFVMMKFEDGGTFTENVALYVNPVK